LFSLFVFDVIKPILVYTRIGLITFGVVVVFFCVVVKPPLESLIGILEGAFLLYF
jgi:hypothetical protein